MEAFRRLPSEIERCSPNAASRHSSREISSLHNADFYRISSNGLKIDSLEQRAKTHTEPEREGRTQE